MPFFSRWLLKALNDFATMRVAFIFLVMILAHAARSQTYASLIITEIMSDPTPAAGLPSVEWIEIKNNSNNVINLSQWRIGDESGLSGSMASYNLQPDSFVIICANNSVSLLQTFGATLGVSGFPSLGNDRDMIFIRSPSGKTIHAVEYFSAWHENTVKGDGGWTLEIIDPVYPCIGNGNWSSSKDAKGGTPGSNNSISGRINPGITAGLIQSITLDSITLVAIFDSVVDSMSAANAANYSIDDQAVSSVECIPPLFNKCRITLTRPLQREIKYQLKAYNIQHCSGKTINGYVAAGLPSVPSPGDFMINEILFDPLPNGYDYIELFNNSKKIIRLNEISIANRDITGAIGSPVTFTADEAYLYPGEYAVVTENKQRLSLFYHVKFPTAVYQRNSLPSLPDDKGVVIILSKQGEILDEVNYSKDWHLGIIDRPEGVALEKISAELPSNKRQSWQSASSTSGYGTPGYLNSQSILTPVSGSVVSISPKVITPDGDGLEDFCIISINQQTPATIVNSYLYDINGVKQLHLVKNELLGNNNFWKWDGVIEGKKARPGIYILATEIFSLDGRVTVLKNTIVVAARTIL